MRKAGSSGARGGAFGGVRWSGRGRREEKKKKGEVGEKNKKKAPIPVSLHPLCFLSLSPYLFRVFRVQEQQL
jgi:hypothetical protein